LFATRKPLPSNDKVWQPGVFTCCAPASIYLGCYGTHGRLTPFFYRPAKQGWMGMRNTVLFLITVALSVVLLSGGSSTTSRQAQAITTKPNFVFILADDMRKDDLTYMPKTRSLLEREGMAFSNAYVSNPLCCPARATIMRGQYAHNTGVWDNVNGKDGGWQGYKSNNGNNENDNIATRLRNGGYRTALIGKYLNEYTNTTYKPPGWDKWFATFTFDYFNYDVNNNGTIKHFGTTDSAYLTDVLRKQTQSFIDTSVAKSKPFFAFVTPIAPHVPAQPASRDLHTYDGVKAPRLDSFNEADVEDKPPWIQSLPILTSAQIAVIDKRHEDRVESLQALDDLVEGVVNKLQSSGQLSNTYIVFTSDNGYHHGEHRIPKSKGRPYEEDIHMPLLIRGPGVPAGSSTEELVLNTDYFPTFTDLAGIPTPSYVDGRSLQPVLTETATNWRSAILLEAHPTQHAGETPTYSGILTASGTKYIEYEGGVRELYNLGADPFELTNNNSASPPDNLVSRLQALKSCSHAGVTCRQAEGGQY
jgi:N-acetylglucosamine-6-sulfatase